MTPYDLSARAASRSGSSKIGRIQAGFGRNSRPAARPAGRWPPLSPRRLALLAQMGVIPDRIVTTAGHRRDAAAADETPSPVWPAARPRESRAPRRCRDAFTLAADTVVAVGRRILPKPATMPTDVRHACLGLLSGRRHHVHHRRGTLITPDGAA